MSVTTKIGNILDSQEKYIVHQTNCVMTGQGGGLAYFMFEKYPYANCYDRSETQEKDVPGTIDIRGTGPVRKTKSGNSKGGERYVINLMGQYYPGGPRYDNDSARKRVKFFQQCLDEIGQIKKIKSIAFPYTIGCGIGGGDWKKYKKMIEKFAGANPKIDIVIYKLPTEIVSDSDDESSSEEETEESEEGSSGSDSDSGRDSGEEGDDEAEGSEDFDDEGSDEEDECEWEHDDVKLRELVNKRWEKAFDDFGDDGLNVLEEYITTQIETLRMVVGIYPPQKLLFNALNLCPLDKTKVLIIGQDPYHGPNQAMGLCFSVSPGIKVPPSLRNIYKEIKESGALIDPELGEATSRNGDLTSWAEQGVLLLNTALTVVQGNPNSHSKQWKPFTNFLIKWISDNADQRIIFVLWGRFAQTKKSLIDQDKHTVLEAAHPSPLAANKGGFFGCNHFVKINEILEEDGEKKIKW